MGDMANFHLEQGMMEECECCGGLSGEHEDDCDISGFTIEETYCKKHKGLWPHECGCSNKKEKKV